MITYTLSPNVADLDALFTVAPVVWLAGRPVCEVKGRVIRILKLAIRAILSRAEPERMKVHSLTSDNEVVKPVVLKLRVYSQQTAPASWTADHGRLAHSLRVGPRSFSFIRVDKINALVAVVARRVPRFAVKSRLVDCRCDA